MPPAGSRKLGVLELVKGAGREFARDEAPILASSLTFYTILSLAPLLVILTGIVGLLGPAAQHQVIDQVTGTMGHNTGQMMQDIINNAEARRHGGELASLLGLAVLIFGAAGVFAQLQHALNRIFDVEAKPGQGLWLWIRKRLLSFGMLLTVAFLLIVSLALTTALNLLIAADTPLGHGLNIVISLVVIAALFALTFKYLPDVEFSWRDAFVGAGITSVLFMAGQYAIGAYLGRSAVSTAYGAAGSLIVLLLWVYYSSMIVFFGAEVTAEYAARYGEHLEPEPHAEWADQERPEPSPT